MSREASVDVRGWMVAGAATVCASVVTAVILLVVGVSAGEALVAAGVIWLNAVPFSLMWTTVVGRRTSLVESWGMGLALSTAGMMLGNVLLAGTPLHGLAWWVIPVIAVVTIGTLTALRRWPASVRPPRPRRWEIVGVTLAVAGSLVVHLPDLWRFPLYETQPIDAIHPDAYMLESLGNAVARFGAGESGALLGFGYRYHWFGYAWSGWLTREIDAQPLVVMLRVLPVVCMIALAMLAAAWMFRAVRSRWAPVVGAFALVVATSVDHFSGPAIAWLSPSHSIGALWLLGLALVAGEVASRAVRWWAWPLAAVMAIAVTGGKASHGAVAVGGALALVVVSLIRRGPDRLRTLAIGGVVAVSAGATVLAVLAGQPDSGTFEMFQTESSATAASGFSAFYGWAVVMVVGLGARVIRWLGLGYALTEARARQWPLTWWAVGGIVVSAAAFTVLRSEFGTSEWFLEGAAVLVAPVAAAGVLLFVRRVRPIRPWLLPVVGAWSVIVGLVGHGLLRSEIVSVRAYAVVVVVSGLVLLGAAAAAMVTRARVGMARGVLGWSAFAGLVISITFPFAATAASVNARAWETPPSGERYAWAEDAMLEAAATDPQVLADARAATSWLRQNAEPSGALAFVEPVTSWASALSGLRLYASFPEMVEGWSRPPAMDVYEQRRALVADYASNPSEATRAQLCADGAAWMWWPTDDLPSTGSAGHVMVFGSVALEPLCTPSNAAP